MTYHILGGLIGGVLASIIVLFVALWWQRVFLPWFENRLYRGPRIGGTWKATIIREAGEFIEMTELKQFGYNIEGSQTYPKDAFGESHTYSLKGQFVDNRLSLIFHEAGGYVDSGAIVLEYRTIGGIRLEGYGVWGTREGELVCEKYIWTPEKHAPTPAPSMPADA